MVIVKLDNGLDKLHPSDLAEVFAAKTGREKVLSFLILPSQLKTKTFSYLAVNDQEE